MQKGIEFLASQLSRSLPNLLLNSDILDILAITVYHQALKAYFVKEIDQIGKYEAVQTFHSANILVVSPLPISEAIMPSSRRSQNLPLEDSLIFSSISSRSNKPSGKAKADAARKVKTDVAAKIIVDAAAKANTADAAVKANCPRNFKRHIIDNFKAAKKTCETHVVELQRQTNAADRIRTQRSQEKRTRSAEIAQFDEEETLRRRREERETIQFNRSSSFCLMSTRCSLFSLQCLFFRILNIVNL